MKIIVTGRHLELPDFLQSYIKKKVTKFEKYFSKDMEVHVTISTEKHLKVCEITLVLEGATLHSQEKDTDFRPSIDRAAEKMETILRRRKEKLVHHKLKGLQKEGGLS